MAEYASLISYTSLCILHGIECYWSTNDKFPGRVNTSPSWIFIYSYDHHGHNDAELSNIIKNMQFEASWQIMIEY